MSYPYTFARRTVVHRASFFIPYLLWLLVAGLVLLLTDRGDLHLALNGIRFPGSDDFFLWSTHLGDRRVAWFVGACLLLSRRFRWGFSVLAATIGVGLLTELFKYQLLGPTPRPVAYFGDPGPLRLVEGFQNHLTHAMPSGHAAIAFALLTTVALMVPSRIGQALCITLAVLIAASRVYLSEHFLEDVYAGSILGVACALLAWALIRPGFPTNAAPPTTDELH